MIFAVSFQSITDATQWATARRLYNYSVKILSDGKAALLFEMDNANHKAVYESYLEE